MLNSKTLDAISLYDMSDLSCIENLYFLCLGAHSKHVSLNLEKLSPQQSEMYQKLKNTLSIECTSDDGIKQFEELISEVKSFDIVELELPYFPSQQQRRDLCQWIRKNAHEKSLIKLTVNKDIIFGCKLYLKGRFFDLSLNNRVEEWLSINLSN